MTQRLFDVSYNREEGFVMKLNPSGFSLVPEPTRGHLRNANKEMLLAIRSVLDQMIVKMDEAMERSAQRQPRKVEVKIGGQRASAGGASVTGEAKAET